MSLNHQQYADLASDAYTDYAPGVRKPGQKDQVAINGVAYNILEHYSNPRNGYQGTIYQRVDTGELVVAHRGTEVDKGVKPVIQDALYTDGSMALSRVNPQAQDAIALTRRAQERVDEISETYGRAPQLTVTGHSLGGTLAQITAHHFGLKGETFNAYGAASLGLRIPEGGNTVLNHVMAGDTVSAASPHFGQVRVYAAPNEIQSMIQSGYANDRSVILDPRSLLLAVGLNAGSHSMHNFTDKDGNGRPDRSILADPNARQLAQQFDPMIDKFRSDVGMIRAGVTLGAGGPPGVIGEAIDHIRGPLKPGEPAERERNERTSHVTPRPEKVPAWPQHYDSHLFGPGGLPELPSYVPKPPADGPQPPLRPQATLDEPLPAGVESRPDPRLAIERLSPKDRDNFDQGLALAQRLGLPPEKAQNFGLAMAAEIKENGQILRTDKLIAVQGRGDDGGDRVFASYHPHGDKEPIFNTSLDVNRAANMPMEQSFNRIEQTQQQQIAQTQTHNIDDPSRGPKMG